MSNFETIFHFLIKAYQPMKRCIVKIESCPWFIWSTSWDHPKISNTQWYWSDQHSNNFLECSKFTWNSAFKIKAKLYQTCPTSQIWQVINFISLWKFVLIDFSANFAESFKVNILRLVQCESNYQMRTSNCRGLWQLRKWQQQRVRRFQCCRLNLFQFLPASNRLKLRKD